MLAFDLDWRESRWQSSTRHNVVNSDVSICVVEIDEVRRPNIDGAERQPRGPIAVDEVEIDQTLERASEWRCVIKAQRARRSLGLDERRWKSRPEKARHTKKSCGKCADAIEILVRNFSKSGRWCNEPWRDLLPE